MRSAVLIVLGFLLCLSADPARAEKRVALVIGVSAYQAAPQLPNPARDAEAMAGLFRKAGFDLVVSKRDLGAVDLRRTIREFSDTARDADIAVVYYAGHGIEVDGTNYLVPADAKLVSDFDVEDETISLDRVMKALDPARRLKLVILDACRDNPFAKRMKRSFSASRSLGRGLVGVEANRPNTFIAFAAREGATAADGDGEHSPFTLALLKHLTSPGLDIRKAFGFIRDDVMSATGNQQEPYTTNSLGGNDVPLVPAPIVAPQASSDPNAAMRRDYEFAERVGTMEAWDSFIGAHPAGFYADLARAQRNKLKAEAERAAAAEKARAAAEDRARLAAGGAKPEQQAHAAEQVRAAESAKLAAEEKKQAEEAAVAAAEAVKQAEQRMAAENAGKPGREKQEQAKVAAVEPPKTAAGPASATAGSMVPVASPSDAAPARPTPPDLPRQLQAALKRVGCKAGDIDSDWNAAARKALSLFNEHAGTTFDIKVASADALDAVNARQGRVCPLDCDRGYRADGGKCVRISCDDGYVLSANGSCQKRPEHEHVRERRPPATARRGGKCFVYGGTSFCE